MTTESNVRERNTAYDTLTVGDVGGSFSHYFESLGYSTHPNGHPITDTINPDALVFVNSSMAPYIGELEEKRNQQFTIHEATVQPSVRLNSLNAQHLIANPNWMTSFTMAGVITSETSFTDMTKQVQTFLTKSVGVDQSKLHYVVSPHHTENLQALKDAGIPDDHIHFQEKNTAILVTWDYGTPGLVGNGITICYIKDADSEIIDGVPHPDTQFLNIIDVNSYSNGQEMSRIQTPFLDVGFGVERLVSLLQEQTPFDTGERLAIRDSIVREAKTVFGADELTDQRIITLTDHLITTQLLLDQGIQPVRRDATKRGYMLRNLIKNAITQADLLRMDPRSISARFQKYPAVSELVEQHIQRVEKVTHHIQDIRETWLKTKAGQKEAKRTRFSSPEMILDFLSYVEKTYNVPSEIAHRILLKIDREAFYLSGFHERYYYYPFTTLEQEEKTGRENTAAIGALLKERGAKNITDYGSGKGRHSIALARQGFEVQALDFDPKSMRMLEAKLKDEGITTVTTHLTDGFKFSEVVEPESQDAVLIFYTSVLASGDREEDVAALTQIRDSLKDSGTFMWSVTNLDAIRSEEVWMPGDANLYINTYGERVIHTEVREPLEANNNRINAHSAGYKVEEPVAFTGDLGKREAEELETYRFTCIETNEARYIVYKDWKDNNALKIARIISYEEALLSIKPYTQSEITQLLTDVGFTDIMFRKGIKNFEEPSNGMEFDIVVTARK